MIQQLDLPPQLFHCSQGVLIPQLLRLFVAHQYEIITQHFRPLCYTVLGGCRGVCGVEIGDQGLLHAEYCVGCLVWIVADV